MTRKTRIGNILTKSGVALLAVLTASAIPGADGPRIPLTLLSVEHVPNGDKAEFALRNDGTTSVVAWVVEVAESHSDSPTERRFLSMDAYEDAAGLIEPESPYRNRVIRPGGTLSWTVRFSPGKGREVSAVNVRPVTAVLENNAVVGDQWRALVILNQRGRDARALGELLSVLQDAQATEPDSMTALRRAVDGLRTPADHSAKTLAYGNLQRALDRAEQGKADPGDALSTLLEQTRRRAAAATAAHVALQSTIEPAGLK